MTAGFAGARIGFKQLESLSDMTRLIGTGVASRSAGSGVGVGSGTKVGKGPVMNRRVAGWMGAQADKNTSKKRRLVIFLIKTLYHMTHENQYYSDNNYSCVSHRLSMIFTTGYPSGRAIA